MEDKRFGSYNNVALVLSEILDVNFEIQSIGIRTLIKGQIPSTQHTEQPDGYFCFKILLTGRANVGEIQRRIYKIGKQIFQIDDGGIPARLEAQIAIGVGYFEENMGLTTNGCKVRGLIGIKTLEGNLRGIRKLILITGAKYHHHCQQENNTHVARFFQMYKTSPKKSS